jgi:hypothetical protein
LFSFTGSGFCRAQIVARDTLAVARRLVAYMMAVDKAQSDFVPHMRTEAV